MSTTDNTPRQKRYATTRDLCQRYGGVHPLTICRRMKRGLLPRPWRPSPGASYLFDMDLVEQCEAEAQAEARFMAKQQAAAEQSVVLPKRPRGRPKKSLQAQTNV